MVLDLSWEGFWWHNINPTALAENVGGLSLYRARGNGVPFDATDVTNQTGSITFTVEFGPPRSLQEDALPESGAFTIATC